MPIYWSGKSKNTISERVRVLRISQNLTPKQLAEKLQLKGCEVTEDMVFGIENGTRFVPDNEVRALAEIFRISYERFIGLY